MNWVASLLHRFNLPTALRSVFFWLFPISTRRHQIAHTLIRNFLIHFRPLNIQYQKWIKTQDSYSLPALAKFKKNAESFTKKPLISILMPVYNPKVEFLTQAILSVIDQVYPHWELCVADDASTAAEIEKTLRAFADQDYRIKVVFRETNGHISAATNSALDIASGEYSALLDHDDRLHPLALYWVAEVVNQHQDCEVIFSDEDKITRSGKRIEPYFKSDFDEELFFSQNMVSHLGVYRTKTIRDIGGFRIGLEGSQDYDLMLRVLERVKTTEIYHIPRILYHWRISKHSVAESVDVKPYAFKAGEKALSNHLENRTIKATVEPYQKYGYKVLYKVPTTKPLVEIFYHHSQRQSIPFENILSLLTTTHYENLTVNGISNNDLPTDQIKATEDNLAWVTGKIFTQSNNSTINSLINASNAEVIVILHPYACSFSEDWVKDMIGILFKPGIGAVSPQLVDKNRLIFSSGIILGTEVFARHIFNSVSRSGPDLYFGWANLNKGYSALPPGCILIKREDFIKVGGFNQKLSSETTQTIDLCLKLKRKGLRNVVIPDVCVTVDPAKMDPSADEDLVESTSDREYFLTFWREWLEDDPAFNPNLTLRYGKPTISKNHKFDYHYSPK